MAISMPDRNHAAALITSFNQTSQSLQGRQDKISSAPVALVKHAHALHDAEVAAALAATPVPTVVATGKPVNTTLTAAGLDSLAALHQALRRRRSPGSACQLTASSPRWSTNKPTQSRQPRH